MGAVGDEYHRQVRLLQDPRGLAPPELTPGALRVDRERLPPRECADDVEDTDGQVLLVLLSHGELEPRLPPSVHTRVFDVPECQVPEHVFEHGRLGDGTAGALEHTRPLRPVGGGGHDVSAEQRRGHARQA